jgi:hypothetical protein
MASQHVEITEAQLAHTVRDPLGRAYNRTTFLPERIAMTQRWAERIIWMNWLQASRRRRSALEPRRNSIRRGNCDSHVIAINRAA